MKKGVLKAVIDYVWPPRMPNTLVTLALGAVVVCFFVASARGGLEYARDVRQAWADSLADRKDAQSEQRVDAATAEAATHEAAADQASTGRQVAEERARGAEAARAEAARHSEAAGRAARKARQEYDQTLASSVDDAPAVPDARICDELRARNIAYSECR